MEPSEQQAEDSVNASPFSLPLLLSGEKAHHGPLRNPSEKTAVLGPPEASSLTNYNRGHTLRCFGGGV